MKIESTYQECVKWLEARGMMPQEIPTLEPIKKALEASGLLKKIDPAKVIIVAGTNGKGSTSATLEALLLSTGARVGLYTSPHLVDGTERVRINQKDISKEEFVRIFQKYRRLIDDCSLSHFEFFTLLAAEAFFAADPVDWAIFEVGLGGTWDATNAIPHNTCVITVLGLDHQNFLGNTITDIAANKFGVVGKGALVVHQPFRDPEVRKLAQKIQSDTGSQWYPCENYELIKEDHKGEPQYRVKTRWGQAALVLPGERGAQNSALALTVFEKLGFDPGQHLSALTKVRWPGRMQKLQHQDFSCPIYLSGDHNPQGIASFLSLLKDYQYDQIHIVVGIGKDKEADQMLKDLFEVPKAKFYLTVTPFKGRTLQEYPAVALDRSEMSTESLSEIFNCLKSRAKPKEMILVTGSLYLVGEALKVLLK